MCETTKIVRAIMRKFGKESVFTNKYEKCRTVKCYVGRGLRNKEMVKAIAKTLGALGVDFSIKETNAYAPWAHNGSIIVRVPLV